jgi:PAS domain S-box-containing protein
MTFSPDYEKLLGYHTGELVGDRESWMALWHPQDLETVQSEMKPFFKGLEPYYIGEYRLKKKDGSFIWIHDSALMVEKRGDIPLVVTGLSVDITEKRRNLDINRTLEALGEALRSLDIGTWFWETKTDCIRWDKKALEIFGLPENFESRNFLELVHPEDTHFLKFYSNLGKGEGGICVFRYSKNGNYRWLRSVAGKVGNKEASGGLIIGITSDITEQMIREDLLKRKQDLLEQKNLELQSFLHIASHDLQEPLRKITYYCARLKNEKTTEEKNYLKWITEGTVRMQKLLMDLSDYNRAGSNMSISKFPLSEVLGITHAVLLSMIEEQSGLLTLIEDVEIEGDRALWEQLIQNLVSNAIKYRRDGVPPLVKVTGREVDDKTIITVQDNGIGINWNYRERIFEPFKRLHTQSKYTGTGMGLALCKRIVEKHSGKIILLESNNVGSAFQVTIPRRISNV